MKPARSLAALALSLALAGALMCSERKAIAQWWLRQRIAALGVAESTLRVAELGLRGIAIEAVALGAVDAPDATIERVEAKWSWDSLAAGRLTALRVRGGTLRGAYGESGLSLGALDAVWDHPARAAAGAIVLPAPEISLEGARVEISTPNGVATGALDGTVREGPNGIDGSVTLDLAGGGLTARGHLALGGTLDAPRFELRLDARGKGRDAIALALTGRRDGNDAFALESGTLHAAGAKLTLHGVRIDPSGIALERGRVEFAVASGLLSATASGSITPSGNRLGGSLALEFAGPDLAGRGSLVLGGSFERPSARIRLDPVTLANEALQLDARARRTAHGAIAIEEAKLTGTGFALAIDHAAFDPSAPRNEVRVRVASLDLAALLARASVAGLAGTGTLTGELPLVFDRGTLRIGGGQLRAEDGGTLRYVPSPSVRGLARSRPGDLGIAVQAFSDFRFDVLEARVDGEVDGALAIGLHVCGSNPGFENGRPVELNLSLESRLADLVRAGSAAYGVPERVEERLLRESAEGNR